MLYRKMGKNRDELSILGYGCMRLPQKAGSPGVGKIDEKRATEQIRMAIDGGINYLDTAVPYHMGACEPFLGKALSDGYRDRIKLATKLPHWDVEIQADMDKLLNAQLGRLKTDHIDYYLIHGLNDESWYSLEAKGVADFIEKTKTDGRVINIGFSFHGNNEAFTTIVDAYDWDFCQIQYNILDEENQAGKRGLKYAASKELGVIIMEPLRGGLLGKAPPPGVSEIWDEAEEKRTPSEWALRWVWNHPEVTVVLSGMNEEDHIKENIKTANAGYPNSLSEADLSLIQKVEDKYRSLMKAGCTGCHYCMPCPNGVNIPACFEAFNYLHMYGDVKWAKFFYLARVGGLGGAPGRASQCEECGDCIEVCPQGLPIPDLLKEITSEMEGRFYDAKLWFFGNIMKFQRKKFLKDGSKPI